MKVVGSKTEVMNVVKNEFAITLLERGAQDSRFDQSDRRDAVKLRGELRTHHRDNTPSVPTRGSGREDLEAGRLMKQNITNLHIVTMRLLDKCKRRMKELPLKQTKLATTSARLVMGKSACVPRDGGKRASRKQEGAV
jgi:hypothetical protein